MRTPPLARYRVTPALADTIRGAASYAQFEASEALLCHARYSTGGPDPYGTSCDLPGGHYPGTDHQGGHPLGDESTITWRGGGTCAGDPLPYTNVKGI